MLVTFCLYVIYSESVVFADGNTAKYKGRNTRFMTFIPFISFLAEKVKYSSFSTCLLLLASGMKMTLYLECR